MVFNFRAGKRYSAYGDDITQGPLWVRPTSLMEDGLDVAQMQAKHMEKIEELTLYVIEQEKKINEQNLVIQKYNSELELLKKQVNALIEKTK
jgi:uncharacterized coiled-coil protein SlyX